MLLAEVTELKVSTLRASLTMRTCLHLHAAPVAILLVLAVLYVTEDLVSADIFENAPLFRMNCVVFRKAMANGIFVTVLLVWPIIPIETELSCKVLVLACLIAAFVGAPLVDRLYTWVVPVMTLGHWFRTIVTRSVYLL